MKNILAALVFIIFFQSLAIGQFGISGAYKTFTADGWDDFFRTEFAQNAGSATGYAVAVNYWFRLKKQRIEFLPEVSYEQYENRAGIAKLNHRILGIYFNTNIYPFDFGSDCDCPTWSKTGNFFTKGFFIQLSPGVWNLQNRYETDLGYDDEIISWTIGGGAGLDLGVSDFLTVTPLVKMYYSPDNTWTGLPTIDGKTASVDARVRQFYAGLKLGFNLNPNRSTRRR